MRAEKIYRELLFECSTIAQVIVLPDARVTAAASIRAAFVTSSVSGVTRPPDWVKGLHIPAFDHFTPLISDPVCTADRSFRHGHDLRDKRVRNVRPMQAQPVDGAVSLPQRRGAVFVSLFSKRGERNAVTRSGMRSSAQDNNNLRECADCHEG
jgi:hypothetical protein